MSHLFTEFEVVDDYLVEVTSIWIVITSITGFVHFSKKFSKNMLVKLEKFKDGTDGTVGYEICMYFQQGR